VLNLNHHHFVRNTCNKVAARSFQLIVTPFANSRKVHAKNFQSLSAQLPRPLPYRAPCPVSLIFCWQKAPTKI
jgi:hypothetical protein